jgi:alpha-tubulin suppressor-like RCC1 family protein
MWGPNFWGTLGDNTITHRSSPVQTISGGTNWRYVSCSASNTAAIKTDGTLWLWGLNNAGQLGDNTITKRSSPVQTISGGTNWKQVASGGSNTAAIKTDGTLWLWGENFLGCLGDNTMTHRSSPVQTVAGGTDWRRVNKTQSHTAAIKTDGTLWLWGYNNNGKLGTNNTTHYSSPVQTVAGGNNWNWVSTTASSTIATKFNN